MKGKKEEKFCMTIGLACNADGSEHWPPIYIGKSKMLRCFQNKTRVQLGFYYWSNKKAWMTSELFEEYAIYCCPGLTGLTMTSDGSNRETSKCRARTAISASLLTIFQVTLSHTNLKTFNLNTSDPCWKFRGHTCMFTNTDLIIMTPHVLCYPQKSPVST